MTPVSYQDNFFSLHLNDSLSSAKEVIPVALTFIQPSSVIDIGCGIGTWLTAWKDNGIKDILGVDGDYVKTEELLVDKNEFIPYNLEKGYKGDRKYGLVTSMEVAEHIQPSSAKIFVDSLCSLGDVILFSAAIPYQEGTLHVNEQYPGYWVKLFAENGFVAVDCMREKVWLNEKVSWWYRQNMLFFVRREVVSNYPALHAAYNRTGGNVLPLIHPALFEMKSKQVIYFKKNLQNPFRTAAYYAKKLLWWRK
jgi:hypothetical protein